MLPQPPLRQLAIHLVLLCDDVHVLLLDLDRQQLLVPAGRMRLGYMAGVRLYASSKSMQRTGLPKLPSIGIPVVLRTSHLPPLLADVHVGMQPACMQ